MNKEFKIPRCQFWLILNLIMMILATTPWCSKLCLKDWVFNWHAHTVPRSILWNSSHTTCSLIYSTIFWVSDFARVITGGVKSHPRAWRSSLPPAQSSPRSGRRPEKMHVAWNGTRFSRKTQWTTSSDTKKLTTPPISSGRPNLQICGRV